MVSAVIFKGSPCCLFINQILKSKMKLVFLAFCLIAFVAIGSAAPEQEEATELERLVQEVAEALHEKEMEDEMPETATKGRRRRRRSG